MATAVPTVGTKINAVKKAPKVRKTTIPSWSQRAKKTHKKMCGMIGSKRRSIADILA